MTLYISPVRTIEPFPYRVLTLEITISPLIVALGAVHLIRLMTAPNMFQLANRLSGKLSSRHAIIKQIVNISIEDQRLRLIVPLGIERHIWRSFTIVFQVIFYSCRIH